MMDVSMSRASEQPAPDPEILEYYARIPEETRLEEGPFQLERVRTQELIERHAPPPPARVLDVGGGAGAYALWLARRGYEVHLLDASPRLVEEARRRGAASHLASCALGDARSIPVPDAFADLLLLLGPLYHLTAREDRVNALREARRAVEPGGVLLTAGISRYASALDGLSRDLYRDARFDAIVERDLVDGQHRNGTERDDFFTTSYFHRPDELESEIADAGLALDGVYGIEGPGWLLPDFEARWADPRRREDLLRVARRLEREPSILGVSAHLIAVARRPAEDSTIHPDPRAAARRPA
jgi:ubiquinone/menaquinone biosynthesis C-methylase UbiE